MILEDDESELVAKTFNATVNSMTIMTSCAGRGFKGSSKAVAITPHVFYAQLSAVCLFSDTVRIIRDGFSGAKGDEVFILLENPRMPTSDVWPAWLVLLANQL